MSAVVLTICKTFYALMNPSDNSAGTVDGVSVLMNLKCLGFRRFAISCFNTTVLNSRDWF